MMERLKEKLWGLPIWAWGVIIGSIFVVWMWVGGRQTSGDPEDDEDTTDATPDYDKGWQSAGPPGTNDFTGYLGNVNPITQSEITNLQWLKQAIATVNNSGKQFSVLKVQQALQKYLEGGELTVEDQAIVNIALEKVGLPPDGTDAPITQNPKPATPTPTAPKPATPKKATPDWRTKISLSAPKTARFGKTFTARATVSWVNPGSLPITGKVPPSKGRVAIYRGDKKIGEGAVRAGIAVIPVRITSDKDGQAYLRARYVPSKGSKFQASSSGAVAITMKK